MGSFPNLEIVAIGVAYLACYFKFYGRIFNFCKMHMSPLNISRLSEEAELT